VSDQPSGPPPKRGFATYLLYAVGLAVGLFILVLLFGKRHELTGAFHELGHLNYWWVLGALGAEALSFVGYAYLQRAVLQMGGATLSLASLTLVSLANIAIAYTIPGEPAVSSAYRYRYFRRRGASGASAVWAILTILIAQAIGMSLLLLLGVVVALVGNTGAHDTSLVVVGLVVVLAAGALLVRRDLLTRFLEMTVRIARRFSGHPRDALGERIESTLARMRDIPLSTASTLYVVSLATAIWLIDFLCLVCCFGAVHAPIPWSGVLLAFGVSQIVASLPFIPGGIGLVEGSLAVILVAYGTAKVPALAVVLLYRLLTFWLAILVGWVCIGVIEWRVRAEQPEKVNGDAAMRSENS
jgi:putative heme transporter